MVVRQGLAVAGLGVGIGLGVSFVVSRLMSTLLYGIGARDPVTFVAVAALLIVVAALASFVPARRAATLDPLRALRTT